MDGGYNLVDIIWWNYLGVKVIVFMLFGYLTRGYTSAGLENLNIYNQSSCNITSIFSVIVSIMSIDDYSFFILVMVVVVVVIQ
jgi:hypothetical protein